MQVIGYRKSDFTPTKGEEVKGYSAISQTRFHRNMVAGNPPNASILVKRNLREWEILMFPLCWVTK